MFYVTYILAELRRRSGRTVLTALVVTHDVEIAERAHRVIRMQDGGIVPV